SHGRARTARDQARRHAAHSRTCLESHARSRGRKGGVMYTMRPAEFTDHRRSTVDEAVALLGESSRPLAGGHSFIPLLKLRLAAPEALVDLGGISGLDGISENGGLSIGALVTHDSVATSQLVQSTCPVLAETAAQIGD